jgi:hypothetical protein
VSPGIFCKTMRQVILPAFSEFLEKRGVPVLSHPPYSPDLTPADLVLFLTLNIAETRSEAVSSIQQTVTRELKSIREGAFLGHSIPCMSDVAVVPEGEGSEGINTYFRDLYCKCFMTSVRKFNCHTVWTKFLQLVSLVETGEL